MKKLLILSTIILVLAIAWRVSKIGAEHLPKSIDKMQEEEGIPIEVTPAKEMQIKEESEYLGTIEGILQANVYGQLPEKVSKVHVKMGQKVRAGQTIFSLRYNPQTMLNVAQAGHRYASINFMRNMRLYEDGAISEMQMDAARYALENAAAQTANAAKYLRIESPISGKIIGLNLEQGDLASPAQIAAVVGRIDTIKVVLKIGELQAAKIVLGQAAQITVNALPNRVFQGEVYRVSQSTDGKDKQYKIYVKAFNPDEILKPGYMTKVKIVTGQDDKAVVIPRDALIKDRGEYYLFTIDNNKAKKLKAELGIVSGDFQQVINLTSSISIVTKGQYSLYDGAKVKIVDSKKVEDNPKQPKE